MRRKILLISAILCCFVALAQAAEFNLPNSIAAGSELKITTSGNGDATLIVVGPGYASRQKIKLGEVVTIHADKLRSAGRYTAVLEDGAAKSAASFFVTSALPSNLAFLARPSRVPAARPQAITGTAFVMDKYNNLVTAPTPVEFELAVPGTAATTRVSKSKDGVAWVRMDSGKKEGPAQFVASAGDTSVRRVVQQVAAEPCNLRMRAQRGKDSILVETDPVRDCSGNPVPDGTIVTFTQVDSNGRSTVDARIKRGIAKAELPPAPKAMISVASGVVVGNEIRWGGGQ